MPDDAGLERQTPQQRCPICAGPARRDWRPFCSRRCADLDLGRWVTGAYAIPSEEETPPMPEDGDA